MNQIICVHVGSKYSNDYVCKLFNACARHMRSPFVFTVLHDQDKSYDIADTRFRTQLIDVLPNLTKFNQWWNKMLAFNPSFSCDTNLLLDLDLVIVGSLDKFFEFNQNNFMIIQDFNRHWSQNYPRSNSSVVRFTKQQAEKIWQKWQSDNFYYIQKYRGDQDWFDEELTDKTWWPAAWVKSWKWEVYNGGMKNKNAYYSDRTVLSDDCSILVFHGVPNPHEVDHDIIKQNWK